MKSKVLFDSAVDGIPTNWSHSKLIDLVNSNKDIVAGPFGSNLKVSDYTNEGVPIIRLQNIDRNQFINENIKYTSQEKADELKYHSYVPGDIVLAKLGIPIGKTCIVPPYVQSGIIVADVVRIRISPKKAYTKFVEYILNSDICAKQLNRQTIGSTRPRVNLNDVRNLELPCPPLNEQKKISKLFSLVDSILEKSNEIILKTKKLQEGLKFNLFSKGIDHTQFQETEIGTLPKSWNFEPLGIHVDLLTGYPFKSKEFSSKPANFRLARGINVTTGKMRWKKEVTKYWKELTDELKKYQLLENDLLIGMDGAKVGKNYALVTSNDLPTLLVQRVTRLRPKMDLDLNYLYNVIGSKIFLNYVRKVNTSSGIAHISAKQIKDFLIPFPPIDEQKKISEILFTVDSKLNKEIKRRDNFVSIKQGLMNDLLTGKKRLN